MKRAGKDKNRQGNKMTEDKQVISIRKDGTIELIYTDKLKGIHDCELKRVFRASHVEPNAKGDWEADLSPVQGPELGPFKTRQEALEAEVKWLQENYLKQKDAANATGASS